MRIQRIPGATLSWLANEVRNRVGARLGQAPGTDDLRILQLNVKNFGYQLALDMAPFLACVDTTGEPRRRNLVSKPTTQQDVESPWFIYWCDELHAVPIYHRKLWEFAFSLQSLFDADLLREGVTGIGFGCGEEPLASYFATKGMRVTVTDLAPERVAGLGWAETAQHARTIDRAFHEHLVSKDIFDQHVRHQFVDMNAIPEFEEKFDFCWSICALEHLGSIERGLAFIEKSLSALKPGGLSVHTTEYNYLPSGTLDGGPTVLFQKPHFEALAERLARRGHRMLGPDFDAGDGPIDRFIDVPPYTSTGDWSAGAHLKLSVGGHPSTCYGLIIRKATR